MYKPLSLSLSLSLCVCVRACVNAVLTFYAQLSIPPIGHMAFIQRRFNVDATS